MPVQVSPNLPANVVEIGNEITQAKINEINSGTLATQTWVSTSYAPKASPTFTGTVTIPAGASISGYVPEAPNDGQQYARQSQSWAVVSGGGGGGLSQNQTYAIALAAIINSMTWNGSNWSGSILAETPYFSANKASYFKFFANNLYEFTPTWSGTSFSLSGSDDTSTYTSLSTDSFTVKWNGDNGGVPIV